MSWIIKGLEGRGISLGNIINGVMLIIAGTGVWFGIVARVETLERSSQSQAREIREVRGKLDDKMERVATNIADQTATIAGMKKDLEWLVRTSPAVVPRP